MQPFSDEILEQLDSDRMLETLNRFPQQCQQALEIGRQFDVDSLNLPRGGVDNIIVCGMGGSAMAGEVLRRFSSIPVRSNRSYHLPEATGSSTLVIAVSYSGNTAETLSSLHQAIERKIPILCLTSGGQMEEIASQRNLPLVIAPSGYQPRAAMGFLTLPLLAIMQDLGHAPKLGPWEKLIQALHITSKQSAWSSPLANNQAKQIAAEIDGRSPVTYGIAGNTDLVAMRWKTQINENAKQPAFWNVFPELNHNEILSLVNQELMLGFVTIFLQNSYDDPQNRARMRIMKNLFIQRQLPIHVVEATGETALAQVFSQIYLGDYVSFYLALLNGVDPTPVELIEKFKNDLAQETDNS